MARSRSTSSSKLVSRKYISGRTRVSFNTNFSLRSPRFVKTLLGPRLSTNFVTFKPTFKVYRPKRRVSISVATGGRYTKILDNYARQTIISPTDFIRPLLCAKRRIRKEIMFAMKKAGKGGQRAARWTQFSHIGC